MYLCYIVHNNYVSMVYVSFMYIYTKSPLFAYFKVIAVGESFMLIVFFAHHVINNCFKSCSDTLVSLIIMEIANFNFIIFSHWIFLFILLKRCHFVKL